MDSLTHSLHFTHFTHSLHKDGSRRSAAKSERDWYPHWLVPSGFSDTAFASRVSPRALRALRPAGFPHRRSITESERGSYPHRLVPTGFPDTAFASPVSPRALRALRPAGFPHTRSAATFSKKSQKKPFFLLKKTTQPRKN